MTETTNPRSVPTRVPRVIGTLALSRLLTCSVKTVLRRVDDGRLPAPSPLSEIAGRRVWSVQGLREFFAGTPIAAVLTDDQILAAIRPLGAECA